MLIPMGWFISCFWSCIGMRQESRFGIPEFRGNFCQILIVSDFSWWYQSFSSKAMVVGLVLGRWRRCAGLVHRFVMQLLPNPKLVQFQLLVLSVAQEGGVD